MSEGTRSQEPPHASLESESGSAPLSPSPSPSTPSSAPVAGSRSARAWSALALLLALGGVAISVFLVREHLAVTEGGVSEGFLCGGGGTFDCNQVAAHPSSWMLGVPVALWGTVYFIVMAGLALATLILPPAQRAAAANLGLLAAGAALVFDAYLGWTMVTQIGAVCLNCVATYAINLLLALAFWRLDRSSEAPADTRALFLTWRPALIKSILAVLVFGGAGAAVFFTTRSLRTLDQFAREETLEFMAKVSKPPEIDMRRFDGRPARGPANAAITIAVAGDFQCHFCRALSMHVEQLRKENPDKIRVIFLHCPLNMECNPGMTRNVHADACWLADAGVCAAQQGKFWEYHDELFHTLPHPQVDRATVSARLAKIGLDPAVVAQCAESGAGRLQVVRDVELCRELGLASVPSMVINGHARRAGVYPRMLRSVVHAMLRNP